MSLLDSLVAAALPLTPRFVVGRVARRYIAGDTLDDAARVIRDLNDRGAACTVDVLGEFISDLAAAERTAAEYGRLLDRIAAERLRSGVSIKLTAFGLGLDPGRCLELVRGLVGRAADHGIFVRVDMEDSQVTDATLEVVRTLFREGRPVGAVLQAYLRRTVADATALAAEGIPVRLCKGIYREPPAIAYQDRDDVRDGYRRALRVLLEGRGTVAVATHDENLVAAARELTAELGTPRERYEYQMLLGVREWMRDELISSGERVRIYVPYGADWYGYSTRRLKENPEIAGHVFKAMLGIR